MSEYLHLQHNLSLCLFPTQSMPQERAQHILLHLFVIPKPLGNPLFRNCDELSKPEIILP